MRRLPSPTIWVAARFLWFIGALKSCMKRLTRPLVTCLAYCLDKELYEAIDYLPDLGVAPQAKPSTPMAGASRKPPRIIPPL